MKKDCPEKEGKKEDAALSLVDKNLLFMAGPEKGFAEYTWIADSGASSHMTNKREGFISLNTSCTKTVTIRDGTTMKVVSIGS